MIGLPPVSRIKFYSASLTGNCRTFSPRHFQSELDVESREQRVREHENIAVMQGQNCSVNVAAERVVYLIANIKTCWLDYFTRLPPCKELRPNLLATNQR